MDMEKVIKAWEAVLSRDPLDAPWDLIDETLALLKEQEAAYQGAVELLRQKTILFDDAIKRLKEQEAIIEQYHKADTFLEAHGWKWEGR